ncbi:MAG: ribosomal protein S18-alanine N-acetyltransferase [Mycoplasmataceae bacterium]|jgi:ribosomal-protein-alanine N-acetyltransferase|nr:ribosomal protein S18-alanine N-acetyltransferase [Mycoplasmataceae bacterium]
MSIFHNITISNTQLGDVPYIFELENKNFIDNNVYTIDQLKKMFNSRDYKMFSMFNGKELCGYSILHITDKIDLEKICIDKKYQRHGLGTLLLNKIFDKYKNKKVILEVNKKNINAINFYKKNNFKQISIRKNYYANNQDAIILER